MQDSSLWEVIGPALAASLMIALTHAPLGMEVLRRGIIFIDLAVAQIAGLGVILAHTVIHEPSVWVVQSAALGCAVLSSLLFRFMERHHPAQQEAIIGCTFVLTASLALLLLADHPHGGEEIQHLLSGQLLFTGWGDIAAHAPVYGVILCVWFLWPSIRKGIGFYLAFAFAITSSVQLAGVYVVFASLILPALAVPLHSHHPLVPAWACALLAVIAGLAISVWTDMPTGPVIVITYMVSTVCVRYMSSQHQTT